MTTLADVRSQYPQYNDMSDEQLASALHEKFYSDIPPEEFAKKIGLVPKQYDLNEDWKRRTAISSMRAENPIRAGAIDVAAGMSDLTRGTLNLVGKPFQGNKSAGLGDRLFPGADQANPNSAASLIGGMLDPLAALTFGVGGPAGGIVSRAVRGGAAGAVVGGLSERGDVVSGGGSGVAANTLLPPAIRRIGRVAEYAINKTSGKEAGRRVLLAAAGADLPAAQAAAKIGPRGITGAQAVADVKSDALDAIAGLAERGDRTSYFSRKAAAQQAARVKALEEVTPDYKAAVAARKTASDPLYAAARDAGDVVDTSTVLAHIDSLLVNESGNAPLVAALKQLRSGLLDEVLVAGKHAMRPIKNARRIASVIDGLKTAIDKRASPQNAHIAGTLHDLKNELVKAIPGYAEAEAKFAQLSAPVNQAELLGAMTEKLAGTGGTEGAKPFLSVLGSGEDALLKKSSGGARFGKIEDVLTPDQMSRVRGVEKDLERNLSMKRGRMAGQGGADEILKDEIGRFVLPNWISGEIAVTNRLLQFIEARVARGAMNTIRTAMRGDVPGQTLSDVLNSLPIKERNRIVGGFYAAGKSPALRASLSAFSKSGDQQDNQQ